MKQYQIAVLEGDGIGPEIIREGVKVLRAAAEIGGISLGLNYYPYGAEHYLKTGEILPDAAIREFRDSNAIYFGAAGDPQVAPGILEVGLILKIRFDLDQYINLRPIKLYPNVWTPLKTEAPIDFYVIRENAEDFYNGMGAIFRSNGQRDQTHHCEMSMKRVPYQINMTLDSRMDASDDYAVAMGVITRQGAERAMRYSFELARAKGKKKVTAVDKVNVLPQVYGLWREVFAEVARDYPEIETENSFADATAMWFVKNPENYGVVVMPNLFGDVITDLGAEITGGLGFAAGGNINPKGVSMFEPIHGSAPKYKGLNVINPVATILSGGMLLENIGEQALGELVERAVTEVLREGRVRTKDMGGTSTTSDMGDAIAAKVRELGRS